MLFSSANQAPAAFSPLTLSPSPIGTRYQRTASKSLVCPLQLSTTSHQIRYSGRGWTRTALGGNSGSKTSLQPDVTRHNAMAEKSRCTPTISQRAHQRPSFLSRLEKTRRLKRRTRHPETPRWFRLSETLISEPCRLSEP